MKEKIVAEANFLEGFLYQMYVGKQEFDQLAWRTICTRIQAIRDEARKENGKNETHS